MSPRHAAFIGRDRELSGLVGTCVAGPGGLSLVMGEAGSGKSRLLEETARRCVAAGVRVLRGHAVPGCHAFRPLAEALVRVADPALATREGIAPFRPILARLLPTWQSAPSSDLLVDPVVVLGEALLELFRALADEHGRIAVLLDDLHWADADTLAVLEYLAGALTALPVRVLAAARSDEHTPSGWSALRWHSAVGVHQLGRLDGVQSGQLARSMLGNDLDPAARDYLMDTAEGLPLLIEELCVALVDGGALVDTEGQWRLVKPAANLVPRAFADMVNSRMGTLEPADAHIVRVAALLGRDLQWGLIPIAAGTDSAAAARALRRATVHARLLVAGPTGDLKWRHALTQDAVLAGLTGPEQVLLSAQAANALDGPGLDGTHLALVAELHARGGAAERAAELLLRLAREHRAAGALAAALAVLEEAAALADDEHRIAVAVERVELLSLTARTDEALAVGEPLLEAASSSQRTALAVALARACVASERFAEAGDYINRYGDLSDPRVLALSAHTLLGTGAVTEAVRLADAVVAAPGQDSPPEAICEALEVSGRGRRRSDPRRSLEAFQQSERLAKRHGMTEWQIRALSELGVNDLFGTGDGQSLRHAQELAARAGMLGTATMLELQLTALTSSVEGPVAAMNRADRCAEQARRLRLPGLRAHALMFVARGRVFAGRPFEADALFDEAAVLAPTPVHIDSSRFLAQAHDAWLNGDAAAAAAELDSCVDVLASAEGSNAAPAWGEWAVLRTALDPSDAGPRERLRDSDVLVQALNRAALHYCDAVVSAESGRPADTARALAAAEQLTVTRPFQRCLLRGYLLQHSVLGDPAPILREALGWLAGTDEERMVRSPRGIARHRCIGPSARTRSEQRTSRVARPGSHGARVRNPDSRPGRSEQSANRGPTAAVPQDSGNPCQQPVGQDRRYRSRGPSTVVADSVRETGWISEPHGSGRAASA